MRKKRVISSDLLLQYYDGEIWSFLNNFRELIKVGLHRIVYVIEFMSRSCEFEALICNAWNRAFVIIILIC
jgi:hypothetical protein